ncbi:hypothetical protein LAV82_22895 [Bacillus sp. ILBB4]|nr:hypothetical protein [Bacillus sp. ILBB4]
MSQQSKHDQFKFKIFIHFVISFLTVGFAVGIGLTGQILITKNIISASAWYGTLQRIIDVVVIMLIISIAISIIKALIIGKKGK